MGMDEIGCAINWIDNEGGCICQPARLSGFFAEEAGIKESAPGFNSNESGEIHE